MGSARLAIHRAARRISTETGARAIQDVLLPASGALASRRPPDVPHSAKRPLFVDHRSVSIRAVAAGGAASYRRGSLRHVGNQRGLWWGRAEPPTARVGSGADPYEWMRDDESKEVKRYAVSLPLPHCENLDRAVGRKGRTQSRCESVSRARTSHTNSQILLPAKRRGRSGVRRTSTDWLGRVTARRIRRFLEGENAYAERILKQVAPLEEELFREMSARVAIEARAPLCSHANAGVDPRPNSILLTPENPAPCALQPPRTLLKDSEIEYVSPDESLPQQTGVPRS
jgi:hypothetical protein